MDMPTPCPKCKEIVEFNEMVNIDGNMMCDECADDHQCCDCGYYFADNSDFVVDDTGEFCESCYDATHCDGF